MFTTDVLERCFVVLLVLFWIRAAAKWSGAMCRWRTATGIWVPGYSVGEYAQIDPVKLPASESVPAAGCQDLRRGPATLQASEPVLCSLLSGEAR